LPPVVIFIGKFIAEIFNYLSQKKSLKGVFLLIVGIVLCFGLITTEIVQWTHYYYTSPFDLNECRHNSYGCKQVAQYLSQIPDIENYNVFADFRMTIYMYFKLYLLNKDKNGYYDIHNQDRDIEKQKENSFYAIWAPESHPQDYWGGSFSHLYNFFEQKYPKQVPIKTIYYPNGMPAIYIFRVKENT
jgi:hypothetical protein